MKQKDEEKEDRSGASKVCQKHDSAVGGTSLLHKITKPTARRGGGADTEEVGRRCQAFGQM